MTLPFTLFIEGILVVGFAARTGRPWRSLLVTSLAMNTLTQGILWAALSVFYRHYLLALGLMEVVIWAIETLILWRSRRCRLSLGEAARLSLLLNLASLGLGWFLPF